MQNGKVDICGLDTGTLPLLTEAEKMQLLAAVRQGDSEARQTLIGGNLRLVLSVVQRFLHRGESPDDLFQVGCIGLIKAIDNFDLSHGVRFSTYAVPMIMGELRRYLRDFNTLRVSRSMRDLAFRAMQQREQLQNELGKQPSIGLIAERLGVDTAEVAVALEAVVDPVSLSEPVYTEGGDAIYMEDQLRDADGEANWLSSLSLRETIAALPERERHILTLRFMQGRTQMEVAPLVGSSQAQVSRLEKSSLQRIRAALQQA
ncbi:MAG: SigB/SigF/SigG family RNA polymerase sigma factor [Oscillospiraceae bacterium]|nr:SigB/SigF/SigG family RNA polymerase sigma factor [Oscillospiraceae bacterium]